MKYNPAQIKAKRARALAKQAKAKSLTTQIRTVAKSEALKTLETKFTQSSTGNVVFNSAINNGFTEMYSLIPPVAEGTGSWQRLDQTVRPVNIRTNWHIALGTPNRSMNVRCVLYCLQSKSIKHYPDLSVFTSGPAMLKSGVSDTPTIYNGNIGAEDLPVDTRAFRLLKCFKFNLIANVGTPNGDTTAGNSPNAMPSYKNLSYTYKCRSQLKYNSLGTYPNGHAPFWVLGYSHTDGTVPDVLNSDLSVSFVSQMTYKDA